MQVELIVSSKRVAESNASDLEIGRLKLIEESGGSYCKLEAVL